MRHAAAFAATIAESRSTVRTGSDGDVELLLWGASAGMAVRCGLLRLSTHDDRR
jgi:hypothetical protein